MEGHLGEHVWGELSGRTERRRTEYKDWDPWSLDYKPVVQKQYLPSKTKSVTREGEWKSTLDFHPSGMSGRVCPGALTGWFAPGADCRNSTAVTPVHIWFSTGNVQGSLGSLTKVSLRFTHKKKSCTGTPPSCCCLWFWKNQSPRDTVGTLEKMLVENK